MFTRKYAAPEVVDRDKRGISTDILSLGCVFVEIDATYTHFCNLSGYGTPKHTVSKEKTMDECNPLQKVQEALNSDELGDTSYQANIDAVCTTIQKVQNYDCHFRIKIKPLLSHLPQMLSNDPLDRPSASALVLTFSVFKFCCQPVVDPLEAAHVKPKLAEESEPEK